MEREQPIRHTRPAEIERASMEIIQTELAQRGVCLEADSAAVVKRVIHTTADFDFAQTLRFTPDAVARGIAALRGGVIVTDTNMALAGISKKALVSLGAEARCFMADPETAAQAREMGTTRAAAAVVRTRQAYPHALLAVGNAPTALLKIAEFMEEGWRPAFVVGAPVGFVNVVESKERLLEACLRWDVPAVVAMGRKGGSGVAAAICNALLYTAAGLLDPDRRN